MTASKEEGSSGDDATNNVSPGKLGIRHLQVLLLFLAMVIGYFLRVGMSVAVVAMANATTANPNIEDYGWDPAQRSRILSSFFWGYTVMQIPSGYITTVWSTQKLLSLGMFFCGVFSILMHLAAHYCGIIAVYICRVGMGVCQGCLLPSVHTLLSKWVPPSERARLATFAYAGAQFGTVIALPISGFLAASPIGWPSIFYIFGGIAVLWSIAFFFFGSDTPSTHSSISIEEKKYIENSLQIASPKTEEKLRTPWKEIWTSTPMWALIIVHCGQNWGYWTLLTEMPTYLNSVLGFDIEKNGGISALPYLMMWMLSFPASWLSDYALKKGFSRSIIRKFSNSIAHWGPAIALIVLGFVPTNDPLWTVIILIVAVGLNAGSLCGYQINHIDLSPNYAGTMMSITNCIASVIAIIAPIICGEIVTDLSNESQWAIVFYVSAGIYFVGNLIFLIWGKGEVQWWNDPKAVKESKEKNLEPIIRPV
ncbi:putative inorganic phosphate cotransporter [Polistes fuscatus]|uniref:putative inorganic phosphate cotransporter n=1 Tax=Polistes fuscatus TaxID=30207 RepID=UPI001CA7D1ED|nr:putative inorganic phosphate cotransporter [Polistes fuscatus]